MIAIVFGLAIILCCTYIALKYLRSSTRIIIKVIVSLSIVLTCGLLYLFFTLAFRSSGPFEPLVTADFFFDKPGIKELYFTPKFFRNHEIAIISSQPFPVDEKFDWKVRVQVYRFGKIIDDHELRENSRYLTGKDFALCNDISYGWIRTYDLLPGKTIVRITVEQGDPRAENLYRFFKVAVRPSGID